MPGTPIAALDPARMARLLEIGRSLVSRRDLDALLQDILESAREMTGAEHAAVGVLDADRRRLARFLTAGMDGMDDEAVRRLGDPSHDRGVLGTLIRDPRPLRIDDIAAHPDAVGVPEGHPPMATFLGVPIVVRGRAWGNIYLANRRGGPFGPEDELALTVLSEWAAVAIENAAILRSAELDRLRQAMEAAEAERRRWARELHDETLQGLAGLRVRLTSALRAGSHDRLREAVGEAVEQITTEAATLRLLITELRPAALDELGLQPAIESLIARIRAVEGLEVLTAIDLGEHRLDPELETATYRVVQEALTNIAKHADAAHVDVAVWREGDAIMIEVRDDGVGFDPAGAREGFGITGMRERVHLTGGTIDIASDDEGTVVRAQMPVAGAREDAAGAGGDGVVSRR